MKPFLVLLLITTLCACSKDTDTNDPLANTTWKIKYSGALLSRDVNSSIPEGALIDAMFKSTINEVKKIGNWNFSTFSRASDNIFFKFNATDPKTSIGTYTFSHDRANDCYEENNEYNFSKLTIDSNKGTEKFALDINRPNSLFVYTPMTSLTSADPNNLESLSWFFAVYELTSETPTSCSTGDDNPLPNADHLVGTWDTEITFENVLQSKGKIIIESISFYPTKAKNYTINGKFQEEVNGQLTDYPFVTTQHSFTDYYPLGNNTMLIEASNGTDTFHFSGKIDANGKYIGIYADDSVYLNNDTFGNFTATKN